MNWEQKKQKERKNQIRQLTTFWMNECILKLFLKMLCDFDLTDSCLLSQNFHFSSGICTKIKTKHTVTTLPTEEEVEKTMIRLDRCVCVWERERERERRNSKWNEQELVLTNKIVSIYLSLTLEFVLEFVTFYLSVYLHTMACIC